MISINKGSEGTTLSVLGYRLTLESAKRFIVKQGSPEFDSWTCITGRINTWFASLKNNQYIHALMIQEVDTDDSIIDHVSMLEDKDR